jgi:flagellar M-ring protein FliF
VNGMMESWRGLGRGARRGMTVGLLLIVAVMGGLAWWIYRADYQVLFADLSPADAAAMTAELDKMKTPYLLGGEGRTILVPQDMVYKTRLQVMGKELPLHGAVGFEVFNNADFGMTDFVQKVNYQRAIQGELQRTILAIEDIQSARVHLAVPEQGLFKRQAAKAKASVTVGMKQGRTLGSDQVLGIQRLVAASVPELTAADVTVLDQHGVALTRSGATDAAEVSAGGQLDAKRGGEDYLLKKVNRVLDQTFGAGTAVASIDLSLNMDQSRVTLEQVLPAQAVVRERKVVSDATGGGQNEAVARNPGSSTTEADYQVGRRTEQLNVASGAVKRMTVAVLVRQSLNEDQVEKLKDVVASAVGLDRERGDALVLYSMQQFGSLPDSLPTQLVGNAGAGAAAEAQAPAAAAMPAPRSALWVLAALLAGAALPAVVLLLGRRRDAGSAQLDDAARARLVLDIRSWIAAPADQRQPTEQP